MKLKGIVVKQGFFVLSVLDFCLLLICVGDDRILSRLVLTSQLSEKD